jgi:predicted RNase H-like HicB family nuclease
MTNRKYALKLVNKSLALLTSGAVSLADLPDSYTLCNGLDELEQMIEEADEFIPMSELLDMAQEVASNMLEDEGMEGMEGTGYANLLEGEGQYVI